jgi:acetyl-CoA C-acetyltransferase
MESMSNAPYLLPKARAGMRIGHHTTYDHMFLDGLENAYDGKAMGCFAQASADHLGLTRADMDAFALESLQKAQTAQREGRFASEITPVQVPGKKGTVTVSEDEAPARAQPEKIPSLRPAFAPDGTITAANASAISDGAAALLLTRLSYAKAHDLPVLGRIVAHSTHTMAPEDFTIAPIGAVQQVCDRAGWSVADVDLFEINEAFAMVTMAAQQALHIAPEKININGGACVLGHPIGASGARILVTLLHALHGQGKTRGIATLCIGGGEAVAVAIERV